MHLEEPTMKRNRRGTILAGAMIITVAGMAAIAVASIPSAGGVINGCYDPRTGSVRVIDFEAGQRCTSRERSLDWNRTGPLGPAGPIGPQGPEGPQGPQGP